MRNASRAAGAFDVMNTTLISRKVVTFVALMTAVLLVRLAIRQTRRILDERYARGETGRDEYEEKRRDLRC